MPPPERGHFVLHTSVLPPVTAGRHELVSDETGTPFDVQAERTQVTVSSPRYTMPPEQILSTFPPANAEGAFGDRLPQIVVERRTLPWERNPAGSTAVSTTPWLALVVVAESEASLSAPTPVEQCVTPGTSLLDPADRDVAEGLYLAVTETVVAKVFPTEEDLPLLVHVREVDVQDTELAGGDKDGWSAVVLANRVPVYDEAGDLPVRYLACLVNLEGQLGALPPPSLAVDFFASDPAQNWSVLATKQVHADQLAMGAGVSLAEAPEGGPRAASAGASGVRAGSLPEMGAALDGTANARMTQAEAAWPVEPRAAVAAAAVDPDAARLVRDTMGLGFHLPIEHYATEPVLRFPVLAHWSFTTTEGATFETLMQDLDVGLLGSLPVPDPSAPPRPPASTMVETGHVALNHQTRRGDATEAWYRGPLVPHPTDRDQPDAAGRLPVAHASDQLRRVVPDGREDLSDAAAYEVGRLLALSQLSVVSALLHFRQEQFGAARVQALMDEVLPDGLRPPRDEVLDLSHLIGRGLVGQLAEDPRGTLGPSRPVADSGRPLGFATGLDELVAGGLGLDLGAIEEASKTVGIAAALAATEVPLVPAGGEPLLEGPALQAMAAALHDEVQRLASLAAPPPEPGGRGPARPDALDALAERAGRDDDEQEVR